MNKQAPPDRCFPHTRQVEVLLRKPGLGKRPRDTLLADESMPGLWETGFTGQHVECTDRYAVCFKQNGDELYEIYAGCMGGQSAGDRFPVDFFHDQWICRSVFSGRCDANPGNSGSGCCGGAGFYNGQAEALEERSEKLKPVSVRELNCP